MRFFPAAFLLLDILFSKVIEEIHYTSYSLRMRTLSLRGGKMYSLDRAVLNDEASRGLLGVVTGILRNESRTFLIRGEI